MPCSSVEFWLQVSPRGSARASVAMDRAPSRANKQPVKKPRPSTAADSTAGFALPSGSSPEVELWLAEGLPAAGSPYFPQRWDQTEGRWRPSLRPAPAAASAAAGAPTPSPTVLPPPPPPPPVAAVPFLPAVSLPEPPPQQPPQQQQMPIVPQQQWHFAATDFRLQQKSIVPKPSRGTPARLPSESLTPAPSAAPSPPTPAPSAAPSLPTPAPSAAPTIPTPALSMSWFAAPAAAVQTKGGSYGSRRREPGRDRQY